MVDQLECSNEWHHTAPARMAMACPECPNGLVPLWHQLQKFAEELQERADGKRGDPSPPQRSTFALVAHWIRRDVLDQASEVHYAGRPEIELAASDAQAERDNLSPAMRKALLGLDTGEIDNVASSTRYALYRRRLLANVSGPLSLTEAGRVAAEAIRANMDASPILEV